MADITRCLIVDDEPVAREILENHLGRLDHVKIIHSCKNAVEAFQVISSENIDLIFLDINMPGISGLSFAKSINSDIKIIFTTAYREYAVDGFDLEAVDYLLKPISFDRLVKAINKYSNEKGSKGLIRFTENSTDKSSYFFVRADRKMIKIDYDQIKFIESFSDYLKIHTDNQTVITRETISSIEAKLPQRDFLRIHRSYIVSMAHISSFTNEYVEVEKNQLSISRSYKKAVIERLENL